MLKDKGKCDGWCRGLNPITHIGDKGYAYCEECARMRRASSAGERCRRLRKWEVEALRRGEPLQSYKPVSRTEAARLASQRKASI